MDTFVPPTLRVRTQLKVEGDLRGLIGPIKDGLRKFGKVKNFTEKNTGHVVFTVVHTTDPTLPIALVDTIFMFKEQGVKHVVLIVSTPIAGA